MEWQPAASLDRQSGRVIWKSTEQANVSHALWLGTNEVATSAADASIVVHEGMSGRQIARLWTRFGAGL
jgi:hypothetical protein